MNIQDIVNKIILEATTELGSRGSYVPPLQPGFRFFKKEQLGPFTISTSNYDDAMLAYDSYDGVMDTPKKEIKKREKIAKKSTNKIKKNPYLTFSDDDGGILNQTPGGRKKIVPIQRQKKINEANTSITAGPYNAPLEIGFYDWKDHHIGPFTEFVETNNNKLQIKKKMRNNIKRTVGVWEKDHRGSYDRNIDEPHHLKEDLAVWFGTKKKPKGSKQPKGPWVNICRKVDGKHPPCGRHDTSKGAYPKCRAAGVAGKMSDSSKRAACQQKRKAEKQDTQTGKGQKPIMTSYKPRKSTNEVRITESHLVLLIKNILKEP